MISIITPIYNRSNLIEETLKSIKSQNYTDWECIIVDDGSTDNTVEVLKAITENDKRFQILVRPMSMPKGPSTCRNLGVKRAKGKYLQFFDSDDIMHPDHLKLKVKAIKDNDSVVCKLVEFSGDFRGIDHYKNSFDIRIPENVFEAFVTGEFPMMMVAPMWKKDVLSPFLPMREDLHILEDHELYARALFSIKKIAVVNKDLIYYRIGENSSTNKFYGNVAYGLDSYFEAKRTVLSLSKTKTVRLSILKMTLGFFRMALAERDFKSADACLRFIEAEKLIYNLELRLKMLRIYFFYIIFRVIKKGDTKFKPLFKL
ncbi:glycosyltransferase family 2 protein [Tamlana crocina]|uniref:Glycosyltransferase n=1 Tax=Tamlana crocina TaxID=393006 RepID=A0ABX1D9L9_9FLAO|nr:glycosyltransferase [Tamlana crocina]NJX15041.1 glycosyltransferase [Tamlana crocina]